MTQTSSHPGATLSLRARNRALLARQLLLERAGDISVAGALEHLGGLQAQAIQPPYYALWSRLRDFDPHELGRMLIDRQAVRMTLMRRTVHLVTADDALVLRPLLQEMIGRAFSATFRAVDRDELARGVREVLADAGQPLSGREIAARVVERGIAPNREDLQYAVGDVALVQVTPRGVWGASGQAKYVALEEWTGRQQQANPSLEDIILRYLRAFGPASVMDLQKWSGLTRCKAVVERLRPELVTFRSDDGKELFDLPDAPRPDAHTPTPVRLLGEFDNVLLSHADRRHIAPTGLTPWMDPTAADARHVNTALIDGMLRATWWIERDGKRKATLVVRPIERLSATERREVLDEAARMIEFAAADAALKDVRVERASL
jgi:hypothetical protein